MNSQSKALILALAVVAANTEFGSFAQAQPTSNAYISRPFYSRPSYQGARLGVWGGFGGPSHVIYAGPFPSVFAPMNYNVNIYGSQYETLRGHTQYGFGYDANQPGIHMQLHPILTGDQVPPAASPPVRSTAPVPAGDVLFHVAVPHDAIIWINGAKTNHTGQFREFMSAGLQQGQTYTYEIKASWTQDGKQVEQTKRVKVQGGNEYDVNFTAS